MRFVTALILAAALLGCSLPRYPARGYGYVPYIPPAATYQQRRPILSHRLYAPAPMVLPPYQRYAPPNVGAPIRCHSDLIGGYVCR